MVKNSLIVIITSLLFCSVCVAMERSMSIYELILPWKGYKEEVVSAIEQAKKNSKNETLLHPKQENIKAVFNPKTEAVTLYDRQKESTISYIFLLVALDGYMSEKTYLLDPKLKKQNCVMQ